MHTELTHLHMTKLHAKELTQEGERDWYVDLTTPTRSKTLTHEPTTNTVTVCILPHTYPVILEVGGENTRFSGIGQGSLMVVDACILTEHRSCLSCQWYLYFRLSS